MLPLERLNKILEMVDACGVVTVQGMVQAFQVSDMTIRRDLKILEDEGRLLRTHGGAVGLGASSQDRLSQRQIEGVDQKKALGQAAAGLISPGATVYLGTGSTVAAMAPFLPTLAPLTVVTPSMAVFEQLREVPHLTLVLIGGHFLHDAGCFVGESSEVQIAQYRFQVAFVSASGLLPSAGFYIGIPAIASLEKTALEAADQGVLVADRRKLGHSALVRVGGLSDLDALVTDLPADSPDLPALQGATRVILASPTAGQGPTPGL